MALENALGELALDATAQAILDALADKLAVKLLDAAGNPFSTANRLPVSVGDLTIEQLDVTFPDSVVATEASRSTPLAANEVFETPWLDVLQFSEITVGIHTDQPSAPNGAVLMISDDGVNVVAQNAVSMPANVGLTFKFSPDVRYFKFVYQNGPTAQGFLRAQTLLHYNATATVQLPIGSTTTDLFSAQNTQAHMKGRISQGPFTGLWMPLSVGQQARTGSLGVTLSTEDVAALSALTDTQLRAAAVATKDDYQAGEVLADQTGANNVLTFTFASPVQLVVVDANGSATDIARADPFGGTPSAALGVPCRDEVPTYMPTTTTVVKVWAPAGMVVSVYGYRRA